MKLTHINLADLKPSALNVRKSGAGDVGELIASIRALGVIQPLLVRGDENGFEVSRGKGGMRHSPRWRRKALPSLYRARCWRLAMMPSLSRPRWRRTSSVCR